jgi:hypothetical protein
LHRRKYVEENKPILLNNRKSIDGVGEGGREGFVPVY